MRTRRCCVRMQPGCEPGRVANPSHSLVSVESRRGRPGLQPGCWPGRGQDGLQTRPTGSIRWRPIQACSTHPPVVRPALPNTKDTADEGNGWYRLLGESDVVCEDCGYDSCDLPITSCEQENEGAPGYLAEFNEATVQAFQLINVLLHELGHHHDRMTSPGQRRATRGERYA